MTTNFLVPQIYRDKLRAEVDGKPFVVPPPTDVNSLRASTSRKIGGGGGGGRGNDSWDDWGDSAPKQSMRVHNPLKHL